MTFGSDIFAKGLACATANSARMSAAVAGLHAHAGTRSLDKVLPPAYRDMWKDLSEKAAKREERKEKEEMYREKEKERDERERKKYDGLSEVRMAENVRNAVIEALKSLSLQLKGDAEAGKGHQDQGKGGGKGNGNDKGDASDKGKEGARDPHEDRDGIDDATAIDGIDEGEDIGELGSAMSSLSLQQAKSLVKRRLIAVGFLDTGTWIFYLYIYIYIYI